MTKLVPTIILGLSFFLLFGCSPKSEDKKPSLIDETLFFLNENQDLNDSIKVKFPSWLKNGIECYGFVKIINDKGNVSAYPIRCKVIAILRGGVKCRILENTRYFEEISCKKFDVKAGATWYEQDGELYKSRSDVEKAIKSKNYYLFQSRKLQTINQ